MKKIKNISLVSLLLLLAVSFNSCVKDDFDVPPILVPRYQGDPANKTIAQLKANYTGFHQITDSIIITGIISGNDESGNIYKSLYFQDGTAGIEMKINQTNMFNNYRVGQRVYLKCKGLYLGDYGGQIQVGYIYNGAIGQIPSEMLGDYLFKDSLPGKAPEPAIIDNIGDLSSQDYTSMLVQFKNATFPQAGMAWTTSTDASASNRTMNVDGGIVTVRTSVFANFKNAIIPAGTGDVKGIFTTFNGAPQLVLRDTSDLTGFPPPTITLLNVPFITDMGSFVAQNVTGDQAWAISTVSNGCVTISGLVSGVNYANEDWLISPAISLTSVAAANLNFSHTISNGPTKVVSQDYMRTNHTVWISTNYSSGNPSAATWTQLQYTNLPSGTDWILVDEKITIPSQFIGKNNVRVAFKYTSDNTNSASWRIRALTVTGNN